MYNNLIKTIYPIFLSFRAVLKDRIRGYFFHGIGYDLLFDYSANYQLIIYYKIQNMSQ